MPDALLSIEGLSIDIYTSHGVISPVRNLDLSLERGEMVGLVGETGSGKSVTAMSVVQLLPKRNTRIRSGRIIFDPGGNETTETRAASDLVNLSEREMRRIRGNDISVIFQDPMSALNPVFTIGEQVSEPLRQHLGLNRKQAGERVIDMLDRARLQNPSKVARAYPHELSGGMVQRAMIALAMGCEPQLLIADEPTTALDVTTQLQILDLIAELQNAQRTSVLLITHDLGIVAQTCNRVAVMSDGEIQERGAVDALFSQPQASYTRRLLDSLPTTPKRGSDVSVMERGTYPWLSDNRGTGSAVDCPADAGSSSDPILRGADIVKYFPGRESGRKSGGTLAVDGVTFEVHSGRTLGVVGESGSGKSTLGRMLLGLYRPTSGQVLFRGERIDGLPPKELRVVRGQIQMVFQDTFATLDPRWSIGRTLAEPLWLHTRLDRSATRDRVVQILEMVGLGQEHVNRFPHEFSGGQRQRIGIARALLTRPEVVVCDEVTSALDVSVQANVLELLKELQKELRLTYVFISHDLSVVELMADDVLVMSRGRVVEAGAVENVFHAPEHDYTKALLAAIPAPDPTVGMDRGTREAIVKRGLEAGKASSH